MLYFWHRPSLSPVYHCWPIAGKKSLCRRWVISSANPEKLTSPPAGLRACTTCARLLEAARLILEKKRRWAESAAGKAYRAWEAAGKPKRVKKRRRKGQRTKPIR